MSTIEERFKSSLQTKLFAKLGKTVTLKSKSAPIYDNRGEELSQTYTSSTITIVPYNITHRSQFYEAFGNLEDGDMAAAIPYTVTVAIDDKITIEGEDWIIKEVSRNYLPGNVVNIVLLRREFTEA